MSKETSSRRTYLKYIGVAAVGGAAAVAGYGMYQATRPSKEAPVTVVIVMMSGPEAAGMRAVVDAWNEEYSSETGINVQQLDYSRLGYSETCNTILSAGTPIPDMVHIQGVHFAYTANLDVLTPLNDMIEDESLYPYDFADMIPSIVDSGTWNGQILALPYDFALNFLAYRKDLMSTPPDTVEEWATKAHDFTQLYNPNSQTKYGTLIGGTKPKCWHVDQIFVPLLRTFGGEFFDEDVKPIFNDTPGVEAVTFIKGLIDDKVVPVEWYNVEYPETLEYLQHGDVALAPCWNAAAGTLKSEEESPLIWDKIDFGPMPGVLGTEAVNRCHIISSQLMCLSKYSQHKTEAFKFLAWATSYEGGKIYAKRTGLPVRTSVFDDPEVATGKDWYPKTRELIDKWGKSDPLLPEFHPAISQEIVEPLILEAYFGRLSPKEALDKAAAEVYTLMEESGYYG